MPFTKAGKSVTFMTDFLEILFTGTGIEGSCPAGKLNAGCYFIDGSIRLKMPEAITANNEFCDCSFRWKFSNTDAHGVSSGKALPAYPTEVLSAVSYTHLLWYRRLIQATTHIDLMFKRLLKRLLHRIM